MRKCRCTFQLWNGQRSDWSEWQRFRALWPRTVKLSAALVSPKWDRHLGTHLNNLFPQWNDWWAGIRWYWCGVEWSRVESSGGSPIFGSAPVVPWFISTAPPKAPGRRFKCVKALCARRWVRASNTHHTTTLPLSVVFAVSLSLSLLLCKLSFVSLLY